MPEKPTLEELERKIKKLEAQLQQAHKMEAIGTLAGGIAHEFNNILGIITGNTELAMDGVPESNPVYPNLVEIHHACLRARDVVRQILALSRQGQEELKPIKLVPIIKDSLKLLRSSLPANIEIRQNISDDSDTVCADPTQINQVLINLCTNAAYAMRDEGGILEINLEHAELGVEAAKLHNDLTPGPYVKLTVRDRGFGIGQKILDRIFDPYFTTKDVGEGTGLGLAVVHGIVKNHGGHITVQSEPGRGSSFQVLLPCIDSRTEIETEFKKASAPKRILIVDDEDRMRSMLRQMLQSPGYEISEAPNGKIALRFCKDRQTDLIITDLIMPEKEGIETIVEIKRNFPEIKIVAISGGGQNDPETYLELAKKLGAERTLAKPFEMKELLKTVEDLLG